jgi:predicted DsbA family dithiol-disulfide isomerase
MPTTGRKITFYHSMVCPRCHVSAMFLSRALKDHPDIEVTKVEFLTNGDRAKQDGVKSIPTLVAGDRKLSGVFLTPGGIRRFLATVEGDPG